MTLPKMLFEFREWSGELESENNILDWIGKESTTATRLLGSPHFNMNWLIISGHNNLQHVQVLQ